MSAADIQGLTDSAPHPEMNIARGDLLPDETVALLIRLAGVEQASVDLKWVAAQMVRHQTDMELIRSADVNDLFPRQPSVAFDPRWDS